MPKGEAIVGVSRLPSAPPPTICIRDSGSGFRVSGFGFRVSGFRFILERNPRPQSAVRERDSPPCPQAAGGKERSKGAFGEWR